MYSILEELLENKGISAYQLSKETGISTSTFSNWKGGKYTPKDNKLQIIADYFGVTLEYLKGNSPFKTKEEMFEDWNNRFNKDGKLVKEVRIIEQIDEFYGRETVDFLEVYTKLNDENKDKTYDYASDLLENQVNEDVTEYYPVKTIEKVAAGIGYSYNENNEYTTYYSDREPKHHDLATKVIGDSMTPKYKNGDVILVKNGYDNVEGAVYVIDYNGKSYVKRVYNEGNRFKMVSINPDYEPFYIDVPIYDEGVYFNIVGKVIDSFTPIEL